MPALTALTGKVRYRTRTVRASKTKAAKASSSCRSDTLARVGYCSASRVGTSGSCTLIDNAERVRGVDANVGPRCR